MPGERRVPLGWPVTEMPESDADDQPFAEVVHEVTFVGALEETLREDAEIIEAPRDR